MPSAYRCYTHITANYGACLYYRIIQPLSQMERQGLPMEVILDTNDILMDDTRRNAIFLESDFSVQYQSVGKHTLWLMEQSKLLKPMTDDTREMRWPPTLIIDTDDDLFNVQPLNVTFGMWGTRRPDGTPLNDGDEVGIAHPLDMASPAASAALNKEYPNPLPGMRGDFNNERFIFSKDGNWHQFISLWKDGGNFDLQRNKDSLEVWKKTVRAANLVTCSTPGVEAYIKKEVGEDVPTFVSPNSINFDDYPEVELREHPDEVRILWQGSATHHEDIWPLNEAIKNVATKYPHTKWIFWGAPYRWAANNIPVGRIKMLPWLHFEAHKTRLSTIGHDINLCPLAPHTFNLSRSAIKWYESSAICRPAATLAQNVGAYADEIVPGETGMLFDTPEDFEEKLGKLIEDAALRSRLAANAQDWVRKNRDVRKITTKLFHKMVEVREEHKATMPLESELVGAQPTI